MDRPIRKVADFKNWSNPSAGKSVYKKKKRYCKNNVRSSLRSESQQSVNTKQC